MPNYYVNSRAQPNGDHEVHEDDCQHGAVLLNREPLGWHNNCASAVTAAKRRYQTANGCYYCSRPCHTG